MKKNTYLIPLSLIFCLFFLWAISSNLLPTMIRQLMKTCELNTFEASFTETFYWLAYFIFPIPIAMYMKRYSYKSGIIFGLVLAACGGLLFIPAAMIKEYWAYLCIFFIIATGMCFLETAANPYVTALGDPSTASRRLNLAQSFNGLGAFIAAMFLSKLVLSGESYTRETLPLDYPGGWEGYIQMETDSMNPACPRSRRVTTWKARQTERQRNSSTSACCAARIYVGESSPNSSTTADKRPSTASSWSIAAPTRDCPRRPPPRSLASTCWLQDMLLAYALVNVVLCAVIIGVGGEVGLYAMLGISFFMSIMYPTQFSLALKDLGGDTKSGSAFLVMAIVGNACLPQLTAYIMHVNAAVYHVAYIVPLVCFAFCAYYGWKGYKVIN